MIAFCQQCAHPKKNGSREPEVFWMCASPQVDLCRIYKNCVSGMGGPVWAIRLINQKWLLQVMVGINIILSVGNEYVKLAWEFTGKPWQMNRDFLHLKKIEMTQKTRILFTYWSPLYCGKSVLKSKGGSIWISNICEYLTWLKLQECQQFSWF